MSDARPHAVMVRHTDLTLTAMSREPGEPLVERPR
ncbi:hypothetical protein SAURM35S_06613 [Streptomyces aurantiogriseus]